MAIRRYLMMLVLDALIVIGAIMLAYTVRFPEGLSYGFKKQIVTLLPFWVGIRLGGLILFRVHYWSFRMAGMEDAFRLIAGGTLASAVLIILFYFFGLGFVPRSVMVMETFITITGLGIVRFGPRFYIEIVRRYMLSGQRGQRTLIVGAGRSAEMLIRDLIRSNSRELHAVCIVDDNPAKKNTMIHGVPVRGTIAEMDKIIKRFSIETVIIAMPSAPAKRIREVVTMCGQYKVKFKILPLAVKYVSDQIKASMLSDVTPEDLLGREPVSFDEGELIGYFGQKTVLVTGAAGSIGSEICRQCASHNPARLVLVDLDENGLYMLKLDLARQFPEIETHVRVASVREYKPLLAIFMSFRPYAVFHAAAHKHVPLMEDMPTEAVKNNIFGTYNVSMAASECGADVMLNISTDKSVNPTSVMGVSKRVGEYVVRWMEKQSKTRFIAVRFGNVLGSAGSVIPIFKKQIADGGPVTLTHKDMTRYFMTIQEAVGLCILTAVRKLGTVCVLDMGEPVKIIQLARNLIAMAGMVPDVDIKIKEVGMRPGEKLFEELLTEQEEQTRPVHPKIMTAEGGDIPENFSDTLQKLRFASFDENDMEKCIEIMKAIVPTYKPEKL